MANQYLIDIHDYISSKIDAARNAKNIAVQEEDPARVGNLDGQLDELAALRRFLEEHFDLPTQSYY